MLSRLEFQPQWVINPPTATWLRIRTCGAHPRIIIPPPDSTTLSSKPSGNH
ncbi:unnamed protein product [Spirodela intermedia]|uniref:Uncharacterized protein n=2 Tax=Spirodela intermedia TaxID=51605 RepID=A0A7I8KIP3_SPIIN|nr:unnamed protein product [Spirodela intermedia]CAA6661202.1 unnamed protein product [Spirodela intermedia]CAA7397561.1 unnamed protein product [Spirodela intermedia]